MPQLRVSEDALASSAPVPQDMQAAGAVDILISRLRKKLEPLDCIKTRRNAGYAFAGARA